MKKTLSLILALVMLLAVCPLAQAEEQVTIRFAWWGDAVRHEATLKAIELFEAKYPHINVEPEYGGWDGYNDKLQTQIAGGTAADVVQDAGACRQLAMLGAEYIDFNDYTHLIDMSKFPESLLNTYCSLDGLQFAMPTGLQAWTTLQNTTLLKEKGIEIPQRWTWDSIVEAAKQLHEADPEAYMLNLAMETIVSWLMPTYIQQKEGGVVINDNYEVEFSQETMEGFFTWLEQLYAVGGLQSRSESLLYDGAPQENPKWAGGKMGITFLSSASYSWYVFDDYLKANVEPVESISFAPGEANNDTIMVPPASWYVIPATSKHVEEAVMLVNFLLTDLDAGRAQGTVRSIPANEEVLAVLQAENLVDPGIGRAVELGAARACEMRGTPAGNSEVTSLYKQYIEEIAYGRISAKDAAAACYDELLMLLDDLRP